MKVGKHLMGMASSTMKECSFELGDNAPFIVFEVGMTGINTGIV